MSSKHMFTGLFSRTVWVSWQKKGRTIPKFNEARYDWVSAGPYAIHLHLAAGIHASTSLLIYNRRSSNWTDYL